MDPFTITRSVRIEADAAAVWASVADAEGLAGWLGVAVDVDVAPGAAGSVRDHDGATRRLVVTDVAERQQVGFVWWDQDEPADASRVVISVEDDGDGTRVTVTETLDPVAVGALGGRASAIDGAGVGDLGGLGTRWDDRLAHLIGVATTALVAVGA